MTAACCVNSANGVRSRHHQSVMDRNSYRLLQCYAEACPHCAILSTAHMNTVPRSRPTEKTVHPLRSYQLLDLLLGSPKDGPPALFLHLRRAISWYSGEHVFRYFALALQTCRVSGV